MSNFRSMTGRTSIIGPSKEYAVPITLDAAYYKGGIVLGNDGFIYHSDGTDWIKGSSGAGTVNVIGSVADVSIGPDEQTVLDAAFPGAVQNDGVIDELTNDLWVYTGTAWTNAGNIVGPTGPPGSQGIQGAASTIQGPIGPTGPVGQIGLQGIQGIQGNFGPTGPQGIQGTVGTALEVIGSVADVTAGPGTEQDVLNAAFPGAVNGNGVLDVAGGDLWVYNGSIWENVGQIAGPTGNQGVQGTTGLQGTTGVQGNDGPIGLQGAAGAQGTQASQGIQGLLGLQGIQGIQGTKGTSIDIVGSVPDVQGTYDGGSSGPNDPQGLLNFYVLFTLGEPQVNPGMAVIDSLTGNIWVYDGTNWQDEGRIVGPTGNTGVQGIQGSSGPQGRQGTQASQGTSGQQGVQGIQGTQGTSIFIIGSVPDVNAGGDPQGTLNTAFPGAGIGDGVIDQALGELWLYNGFVWSNTGNIVGPQGATGQQGTQGSQGVQGTQGRQGIQGLQGISGFVGGQGLQGIQGISGSQGTQGRQGLSGVVGGQGIQGIRGVQGTIGPQGVQGVDGIFGAQGIQGTQGIQGDQGLPGDVGNLGPQGIQGTQGTQASQGILGQQGLQGLQGVIGVQGTFGPGTSLDTIADNASVLLYPVLVDGTGAQTPKITDDAGKLEFNALTGVLTTTATAARFADLAEKYISDAAYAEGTVLIIGGAHEVTESNAQDSSKVAGVVSLHPSFLMNSELEGEHVTTVALRGRVPCKVVGKVNKGDVLVTSPERGYAMASAQPSFVSASCLVGKALEDKDTDGPGIIEIMV